MVIQTLITTGKLAFWTTLILFLLGLPIAYFLAFSKFRLKAIIEALISMPMVLPPTVLGFYILVAYSPQNWFGKMMEQWFNVHLAFSFSGILIASILCSLPFYDSTTSKRAHGLITKPQRSSLYNGKIATDHLF